MMSVLLILALGIVTWLYFTWLMKNAVIAGIFMSATLVLGGLLAGALVLVWVAGGDLLAGCVAC